MTWRQPAAGDVVAVAGIVAVVGVVVEEMEEMIEPVMIHSIHVQTIMGREATEVILVEVVVIHTSKHLIHLAPATSLLHSNSNIIATAVMEAILVTVAVAHARPTLIVMVDMMHPVAVCLRGAVPRTVRMGDTPATTVVLERVAVETSVGMEDMEWVAVVGMAVALVGTVDMVVAVVEEDTEIMEDMEDIQIYSPTADMDTIVMDAVGHIATHGNEGGNCISSLFATYVTPGVV